MAAEKDDGRFDRALMHAAARLYYLDHATQAEIATQLGTSRPTVSRLLAEARRLGIVRIEVRHPEHDDDDLAERTAEHLGLHAVHLATTGSPAVLGVLLAPPLRRALETAGLRAGDVLLVSSGRSVHACAQQQLPPMPGVRIAPTLGGQDEPEAWYQTNEITRQVAARVGGAPTFLYAPALPSAALREHLLDDPGIQAVLRLWDEAACALLGVGAPPATRSSLPGPLQGTDPSLRSAVGDVCGRFYDATGTPIDFPGSERLLATSLESLRRIRSTIAVAVGADKVPSICAAARAGWFNRLVTDAPTARALLAEPGPQDGAALVAAGDAIPVSAASTVTARPGGRRPTS